jgi:Leucine-rich repeat (LRR) protein
MHYFIYIAVGILILTGAVYWTTDSRPETVESPVVPTEVTGVGVEQVQENETEPQIPLVQKPPTGASLDLSGQGLTRVPEYVFSRTDLTSLDLSGNKLTGALQAEVRHLQKLRTLDLSNNDFTGVPAEVGQLSNLEVLDLSDNPLTGLPYELGNLSNLKTLDLRGTQYSTQDLAVIRAKLSPSTTVLTD